MRCGTLTIPQTILLASYLLVLGTLDELGIANRPMAILAIGLAVAIGLVLTGRCLTPAEEK